MIYSRSAEYGIRALVHMAAIPPDEFAMARTIAADEEIPPQFLAKILQDLARVGLLKSTKGPGGGFRLARPATEVSLLSVVEAIDGADRLRRCIAGQPECTDQAVCGMHHSWKVLRSRIIDYLGGTSIADVAKALGEKRRLLARPRRRTENRGVGR